jgi:hypothetical protein
MSLTEMDGDAARRIRSRAEIRWIHRDRIKVARSAAMAITHDYDIRGLVLSGVFIVNQGEEPVTYRAGEIFDVPPAAATPRRSGRREQGLWWGGNIGGAWEAPSLCAEVSVGMVSGGVTVELAHDAYAHEPY